jgi:hypothetical protein
MFVATTTRDGRSPGPYPSPAVADLAADLAVLLKHDFAQRGPGSPEDQGHPQLQHLREAAAVRAQSEWQQLTACSTLEDALQQLASSNLAERVSALEVHPPCPC